MKLLEKILVPIGLNRISDYQMEAAVNLAGKFSSQLIFAYIMPEDAQRDSVRPMVEKFADTSYSEIIGRSDLSDIGSEKRVLYGNMFDRIISTAEDENVNLILVSNDMEQSGGSFHIDVLAEKLMRKSQKPVWVVKEGGNAIPENILCSVDYSDASERALNNAVKIARAFRARLFIVNVFEPMEYNYSPRFEINYEQENQKNQLENSRRFTDFLAGFNFTGLDVHKEILKGSSHEEIVRFVQQNRVDLLFMGAVGKTYLQRIFLGSVTEKVIREFPCSMVVTKSENILNLQIDADISEIERHIEIATTLEETGYYEEAIEQIKIALQINDLHLPALSSLIRLYSKTGDNDSARLYHQKIDQILKRLWDSNVEMEIRKSLKL
jgi:nucleotide-binding universal stress UspA family protein